MASMLSVVKNIAILFLIHGGPKIVVAMKTTPTISGQVCQRLFSRTSELSDERHFVNSRLEQKYPPLIQELASSGFSEKLLTMFSLGTSPPKRKGAMTAKTVSIFYAPDGTRTLRRDLRW
jgi:hypothetical protein